MKIPADILLLGMYYKYLDSFLFPAQYLTNYLYLCWKVRDLAFKFVLYLIWSEGFRGNALRVFILGMLMSWGMWFKW